MNSVLPSNRKFGYFFTLVFFLFAIYSLVKNGGAVVVYIHLFASFLIFLLTFFIPNVLSPFNKGWFWIGQMLGKIVSPVVLGLIFFVLITPVALISKLLGRDELKLRRPNSETYWVDPVGSSSDSESFKNQF